MLILAARRLCSLQNVEAARLRTWFNLQPPDPGEGYSAGYPHVHANADGKTFVIYVSEDPSPLDILDDGELVQTMKPEIGDAIFIPNGVWHGVHRNPGPADRVALIVTAYSS